MAQDGALSTELVDLLFDLFVSRSDAYALQLQSGGYSCVKELVTKGLIQAHLKGELTVALYPIDPSSDRCRLILFDVDPERFSKPAKVVESLYARALRVWNEGSISLEASRYPDPSYHLWVFFAEAYPARVLRWLGKRLVEKAGHPEVEVFPKQNSVGSGFGNPVKLPLGLHREEGKWSRWLDPHTFQPLPNDVIFQCIPAIITGKDLSRIETVLAETLRRTPYFATGTTEARRLSSQEKKRIINLFVPYWRKGYRNDLNLYLCGFFIKRSIVFQDAHDVIDGITTLAQDEEKSMRLKCVEHQYKYRAGNAHLKGITGITEIVSRLRCSHDG